AAAPFLPETGDVRLLAWITAASAVTGACLAWLAERLNRRGIRRFLTGPGNSRAQDTAELHRPRLTGYFFGQTVASCLSAMLAAFLGATLSQDITPGLGMLALFAAPYAWLCLWPVIGMQLRDWRRQAAGGRATLSFPPIRPRRPGGLRSLLPNAPIVLFEVLLPTIVCVCLFVGGLVSFR
ncbi:MAG: hypothetical protein Q4E05_12370, partial [Pseudoclavibacter sp.]|nr:hypothetical protein [Pseudoclavibacter sp.]